jgi:acyl dehydratase
MTVTTNSADIATAMGVEVGDAAEFEKTFTETDIGFFSALSGDFDPVHVSERFAGQTVFGRRIAHGLGVLALLSAAESDVSRRVTGRGATLKAVSLGYDKVRFLKPVFIGDTVTARYTIVSVEPARLRATGRCEVVNQDGELCLTGEHIMKWVEA